MLDFVQLLEYAYDIKVLVAPDKDFVLIVLQEAETEES